MHLGRPSKRGRGEQTPTDRSQRSSGRSSIATQRFFLFAGNVDPFLNPRISSYQRAYQNNVFGFELVFRYSSCCLTVHFVFWSHNDVV